MRKRLVSRIAVLAVAVLTGCGSTPKAETARPAAEGTYAFWPQFPAEPRVQFLATYSSSDDVQPKKMSGLEQVVFGKESVKPAFIEKPYGVAMRDGRIYVADMRGQALAVLDLKKKQTRLVGVGGLNRLEHPVAVAVAEDGMIYVADNARGTIFVYDAQERFVKTIGYNKLRPVAVAVHGERLYVADLAAQQVAVLNRRDGATLGMIGSVGDEDGQFRTPLGVSTDKAGNVYVVDMMRCRVQKFTPEGKLVAAMGEAGDSIGMFARPKHIAVDSDGIVYVVDAAFANVQMFSSDLKMLMHFGSLGTFPGAMDLPAGITVCEDESVNLFRDKLHPGFAPKRLLIVTNQFGPAKVSVYAMGERRPEYSAQDLAAAAVPVPSGTGVPSAEQLRIQNPGGIEPGAEPGDVAPEPAKTEPNKESTPK